MSLRDEAPYIADGKRVYGTQYPPMQKILKNYHAREVDVRVVTWRKVRHAPKDWHDPGDDYSCVVTNAGVLIGEIFNYQLRALGLSCPGKARMAIDGPIKGDPIYTARLLPTSQTLRTAQDNLIIHYSDSVFLVQSKDTREKVTALCNGRPYVELAGVLKLNPKGNRYECVTRGLCVGRTRPSEQEDLIASLQSRLKTSGDATPNNVLVTVVLGSRDGKPYSHAFLEQRKLEQYRAGHGH